MNVDGEQLYYDLVSFIQQQGIDIPSDADGMLGDAAREIADFNNGENQHLSVAQ